MRIARHFEGKVCDNATAQHFHLDPDPKVLNFRTDVWSDGGVRRIGVLVVVRGMT